MLLTLVLIYRSISNRVICHLSSGCRYAEKHLCSWSAVCPMMHLTGILVTLVFYFRLYLCAQTLCCSWRSSKSRQSLLPLAVAICCVKVLLFKHANFATHNQLSTFLFEVNETVPLSSSIFLVQTWHIQNYILPHVYQLFMSFIFLFFCHGLVVQNMKKQCASAC